MNHCSLVIYCPRSQSLLSQRWVVSRNRWSWDWLVLCVIECLVFFSIDLCFLFLWLWHRWHLKHCCLWRALRKLGGKPSILVVWPWRVHVWSCHLLQLHSLSLCPYVCWLYTLLLFRLHHLGYEVQVCLLLVQFLNRSRRVFPAYWLLKIFIKDAFL